MTTPYAAEVERVLRARRPRSLLAVGEHAHALLAGYTRGTDCRYVALTDTTLAPLADERFDLALVAPAAGPSKTDTMQLVAALRDRYARHLLVAAHVDTRSGLTHAEYLALGMRHIGNYGSGASAQALYEFDIVDYKHTPDWLNSEHWAHPELFDKFRW